MICTNCQVDVTELSRTPIPAAVYPPEYEISTEPKVEVAYKCQMCQDEFWVWEKVNEISNTP